MKRLSYLLNTALAAFTLLAGAAFAADLDQAKGDGLVGERADGYLGLVRSDAAPDVVEMVKSVNAKRRAEYQRIASENDLTIEEVQALAGRKAMERTAAGHWIMRDGGWQQK
jgi:uncharacterized protein YdbL (DUF1318 family)